jgi:hypothetical protein
LPIDPIYEYMEGIKEEPVPWMNPAKQGNQEDQKL